MAKKKLTKLERSNRAHQRLLQKSNYSDYHIAVINTQVNEQRVLSKPEREDIFKKVVK